LFGLVADFFGEGIFRLKPVALVVTHIVVGLVLFVVPATFILTTMHLIWRATLSTLGALVRF